MYPFHPSYFLRPRPKYLWVKVRILQETNKAILVYTASKIWIPKSRIYGIRLKNNVFEIYVEEEALG